MIDDVMRLLMGNEVLSIYLICSNGMYSVKEVCHSIDFMVTKNDTVLVL